MIIVPDCQGTRPSYSVELKYSPSSISHSSDKNCKKISLIDQIILALIITFLYKIFVHTLSWFAHKYIYGTSYTVYHFIMLLFIWLVFIIFPPILSFKTIILLLMHGSSWCTICTPWFGRLWTWIIDWLHTKFVCVKWKSLSWWLIKINKISSLCYVLVMFV